MGNIKKMGRPPVAKNRAVEALKQLSAAAGRDLHATTAIYDKMAELAPDVTRASHRSALHKAAQAGLIQKDGRLCWLAEIDNGADKG